MYVILFFCKLESCSLIIKLQQVKGMFQQVSGQAATKREQKYSAFVNK